VADHPAQEDGAEEDAEECGESELGEGAGDFGTAVDDDFYLNVAQAAAELGDASSDLAREGDGVGVGGAVDAEEDGVFCGGFRPLIRPSATFSPSEKRWGEGARGVVLREITERRLVADFLQIDIGDFV
jgi:hypothetical protein